MCKCVRQGLVHLQGGVPRPPEHLAPLFLHLMYLLELQKGIFHLRVGFQMGGLFTLIAQSYSSTRYLTTSTTWHWHDVA